MGSYLPGSPGCPGCLTLTVKNPPENSQNGMSAWPVGFSGLGELTQIVHVRERCNGVVERRLDAPRCETP